jgi:hypothetical protein
MMKMVITKNAVTLSLLEAKYLNNLSEKLMKELDGTQFKHILYKRRDALNLPPMTEEEKVFRQIDTEVQPFKSTTKEKRK